MNPNDAIDVPRDRWLARLLASAAPDERGGVLRLKLGYNPNSSSVGSVVTTLLWTATFGAAALNIAAALLRERASTTPPVRVGAPSVESEGDEDAR